MNSREHQSATTTKAPFLGTARDWLTPACVCFGVLAFAGVVDVHAADLNLPGVDIRIGEGAGGRQEVATPVKILIALTVLDLAPALLIGMTSLTRIIILLAMLPHATGMQD